ncbi:MAG: SDR family NAD(P)-dependent oxidoreductase [Betaproteobacteria bacterium]|jgi:NAD(P)-dependent dehydrogenase (short-subunit alcohol dehydrogenase family)
MTELFILTGASRGLGRAIASRLLAPDIDLLTLSRKPDASLAEAASARGAHLEQWAADVSNASNIAARLEAWLHGQDAARFARATLINNAGIIGRVGRWTHRMPTPWPPCCALAWKRRYCSQPPSCAPRAAGRRSGAC